MSARLRCPAALAVFMLTAAAWLPAQKGPEVFVLPAPRGVAVVLGDTEPEISGFLVSRAEPGSDAFRPLVKDPIEAVEDPHRAAELMGSDYRWLAGKIGTSDPSRVWSKLRADPSRAELYCLVSHGLRMAMGRTLVDLTAEQGTTYRYRIELLDSDHKRLRTIDRKVTAGEPARPVDPTDLEAEVGDREVTLRWRYPQYRNDESDLCVAFHVYRREGGGREARLTVEPVMRAENLLLYYDEAVENGSTYVYTVRAVDIIGTQSPGLRSKPLTPVDASPPLVPSGVTAVDTEAGMLVIWNISPDVDAAGYRVYRSLESNDKFEKISPADVAVAEPRFLDEEVIRGRTYFYKVSAVDRSGNESAPAGPAHVSPRDRVPPPAVGRLAAEVKEKERHVRLSWEAPEANDLRGYFVYRGNSREQMLRLSGKPMAFEEGETLEYLDAGYRERGLLPGSSLIYAVSAVDLSYNEGPLEYVEAVVPDNVPPAKPFSLTARSTREGEVRLSWMARREEAIDRFLVYREVEGGGARAAAEAVAVPGTLNAWIDAEAQRGVRYSYRLTAVDAAGNESDAAGPVTIVPTDVVPPSAPADLAYAATEKGVKLSWTPPDAPDLKGYRVYRATHPGAAWRRLHDGELDEAFIVDEPSKPGYRYAVSAVDSSGNEGERATVEVAAEAKP